MRGFGSCTYKLTIKNTNTQYTRVYMLSLKDKLEGRPRELRLLATHLQASQLDVSLEVVLVVVVHQHLRVEHEVSDVEAEVRVRLLVHVALEDGPSQVQPA